MQTYIETVEGYAILNFLLRVSRMSEALQKIINPSKHRVIIPRGAQAPTAMVLIADVAVSIEFELGAKVQCTGVWQSGIFF